MPEESTSAAGPEKAGEEHRKESGWAGQNGGAASTDSSGGGNGGGGETGGSRQKNLERPTAEDIYEQVALNAKTELKRSTLSLAISGYAGGIFMGLSGLGTALVLGLFGTSPRTHFVATHVLSDWFHRGDHRTGAAVHGEHPVSGCACSLREARALEHAAAVVHGAARERAGCADVCGAGARTGALHAGDVRQALMQLGLQAAHTAPGTIFWSGVTAGWIIATAAWLVSGSHSITGSVMMLWILTFVVGLGNFAHCIATSGEIFTAVLDPSASAGSYFHWLWIAVAGNICGGVFMVTLLEYGQAILAKGERPAKRIQRSRRG